MFVIVALKQKENQPFLDAGQQLLLLNFLHLLQIKREDVLLCQYNIYLSAEDDVPYFDGGGEGVGGDSLGLTAGSIVRLVRCSGCVLRVLGDNTLNAFPVCVYWDDS